MAHGFNSKLATRHPGMSGALAAMLSACALTVCAQIMNDPTRPPAGATANAPDGTIATAGTPVLQSVMISPTQRSAIINGELVKLGARYGDARVIRITENEVILRSPAGDGALLHLLHERTRVIGKLYAGDTCQVEVEAPESVRKQLAAYLVE